MKWSVPWNPGLGVYSKVPSGLNVSTPLLGPLTSTKDCVSPSGSVSFKDTSSLTAVSGSV